MSYQLILLNQSLTTLFLPFFDIYPDKITKAKIKIVNYFTTPNKRKKMFKLIPYLFFK